MLRAIILTSLLLAIGASPAFAASGNLLYKPYPVAVGPGSAEAYCAQLRFELTPPALRAGSPFMATCMVTLVVTAVTEETIIAAHSSLGVVVHTTQVLWTGGPARLYTGPAALLFARLLLALGAAFLGVTGRVRIRFDRSPQETHSVVVAMTGNVSGVKWRPALARHPPCGQIVQANFSIAWLCVCLRGAWRPIVSRP